MTSIEDHVAPAIEHVEAALRAINDAATPENLAWRHRNTFRLVEALMFLRQIEVKKDGAK